LLTNDYVRQEFQLGLDLIEPAWGRVSDGTCGKEAARWCVEHRGELPQLKDYARLVIDHYKSLPRVLCHREAAAYHAGRRRSSGELVYFDLSTVGIAARFWDVANWCEEPPPDSTRLELARQYLKFYTRWGGTTVSVEQLLDETALIVRAQRIRWLWQMFSDWDETGDSSSGYWTYEALKQLLRFKYTLFGWEFA
jgi:hypothetical protein